MTAKPKLTTGDVVTLKGQTAPLTVVPPVANNAGEMMTRDGWVWCAVSCSTGVAFSLLPIDALAKKAAR